MSYQLAVFDMDGTLLDTIEDLAQAVNHALRLSGLPERTVSEVRGFVGNGIRRTLELSAPSGTCRETLDRLYNDFTVFYEAHSADHTVPYPGLTALLRRLQAQHILAAVVSNKQDSAVRLLSDRFFPGLFAMTAGQRDGIRRKPAPDSVFSVLNALHIPAGEAVYIGDSEVDLQTAANAGLPCITVSWGYRSPEALLQAGSREIAGTPEELLDAIMNGKRPV